MVNNGHTTNGHYENPVDPNLVAVSTVPSAASTLPLVTPFSPDIPGYAQRAIEYQRLTGKVLPTSALSARQQAKPLHSRVLEHVLSDPPLPSNDKAKAKRVTTKRLPVIAKASLLGLRQWEKYFRGPGNERRHNSIITAVTWYGAELLDNMPEVKAFGIARGKLFSQGIPDMQTATFLMNGGGLPSNWGIPILRATTQMSLAFYDEPLEVLDDLEHSLGLSRSKLSALCIVAALSRSEAILDKKSLELYNNEMSYFAGQLRRELDYLT